jgi:hypothetical protein
MAGWKDWQVGEVVTEADFQSFLQDQVLFVFDDAADRDATITSEFLKVGMFSFLKDAGALEFYSGSVLGWLPFSAGATGGGSDQVFYENDQEVTTDYEISTGANAMSAGPVEILSGATVTVPVGSVWTVV